MKLSRRMFLRGAGGAAIALPLLHDLPGARAQAAAPIKRFIVMFSPNGTIPTAWASTGQGTTFAPGPIFNDLVAAGHKSDLVVMQGLDMSACLDGPGGDAHGLGIGCLLTGTELAAGNQFEAGMGGPGSGWPSGISVDQLIASMLPKRQHLSIDFSIKRMSGSIWSRMSYTGPNGQVVEPFDDPTVAFDTLFANVGDSASTMALQAKRRKSVLDQVVGELQALDGALSGADKMKVDAHLTQIREIETQLQVAAPASACTKPPKPALVASAPIVYNASGMETKQDPSADVDVPMRHDLVRKMLAAAMACDMARVGTIMMAPSRSDIFLSWLNGGVTESHHDYSHDADSNTTSQQKLVQINQWYAAQVAAMITLLKSLPEGGGTMFDNTVILWANELGIGNAHTHTQIPLMLAGSAGKYLKTGQAVTMPKGTPHNRLLLTICQAMGLSNVTAVGNPKFCADGPVKEIVA
jgi:Protein of unknown function (DUF1552)